MLRRSARAEVFAAVFFEAGRNRHGWAQRDAGVFAARGGGDADAEQEAVRGAVSAGRRGWTKHRSALCGAELLPHAADDRDSAAATWRNRCGCRSRRILRIASESGAARNAISKESDGYRARGGFSGSHALAF